MPVPKGTKYRYKPGKIKKGKNKGKRIRLAIHRGKVIEAKAVKAK